MRNRSVLLVVVLAGACLSAQDKSVSSAASASDSLTAKTQWRAEEHGASEGCPVKFGAAVSSRAVVRSTTDLPRNGSAVLLQLSFNGVGAPKIFKASVRVHGWAPARRFLPVGAAPQEDRTQVFQLVDTSGGAGLAHRDLWVSRMLVRWAEITELRYADGSVWRASKESYCRATPSLFHLVDAAGR
jgi:hypothetical protein